MKQFWTKWAVKIDALSLRERGIIFAAAAMILIVLINTALLDPQYAKQATLLQQMKQQQAQIDDMQNQIQQKAQAQGIDPDQANRVRLQVLEQRTRQMNQSLSDLQKGLVPPEKMADLLENVLKKNDKLLLVSLKTLPVTSLNGEMSAIDKVKMSEVKIPAANQSGGVGVVFKHTVELKVQGSYMDMLSYMKSLQGMPWQVFWGGAQLSVDEYPNATLTLTLFTLSLDKKWLNL